VFQGYALRGGSFCQKYKQRGRETLDFSMRPGSVGNVRLPLLLLVVMPQWVGGQQTLSSGRREIVRTLRSPAQGGQIEKDKPDQLYQSGNHHKKNPFCRRLHVYESTTLDSM
jgi:hypothetical protein